MKINTLIFATITPKPQYFQCAKSALLGMLSATRQESGCVQFQLHESECGQYIYLYEEWLDK